MTELFSFFVCICVRFSELELFAFQNHSLNNMYSPCIQHHTRYIQEYLNKIFKFNLFQLNLIGVKEMSHHIFSQSVSNVNFLFVLGEIEI